MYHLSVDRNWKPQLLISSLDFMKHQSHSSFFQWYYTPVQFDKFLLHKTSCCFQITLQTRPLPACSVTSVMSNSLKTFWTVAHQAPLSMGFSSQEYWSGLPWAPLGNLPDPGLELTSPVSPELADSFFLSTELPRKLWFYIFICTQFWNIPKI